MPHSEELDNREVLAVHQLNIAFQEERQFIPAVQNLSFSLNRGETLAIVGESGTGKSVTALALMRLLEQTGGQVSCEKMLLRRRNHQVIDLNELSASQMQSVRGADAADGGAPIGVGDLDLRVIEQGETEIVLGGGLCGQDRQGGLLIRWPITLCGGVQLFPGVVFVRGWGGLAAGQGQQGGEAKKDVKRSGTHGWLRVITRATGNPAKYFSRDFPQTGL